MVNRGDSYQNLPSYTSFDLAWLAPITYPLALSLVAIFFALREGYLAGLFRTSSNALATVSVTIEAFFAVLCFIQCVLNYSQRAYVGGAQACDFQAWYACFWVFSSCLLQPLIARTSFFIRKFQQQPSKSACLAHAGLILLFALLVSLFPVMGVGYYGFPKDYCMFEIQDVVMGSMFLATFFVALVVTGAYHIGAASILFSKSTDLQEKVLDHPRDCSDLSTMPTFCGILTPARLQIFMLIWFLLIWSPTAIVVLLYQVGAREPPVNSTESALVAVSLHSQQLFNPLLVGILWRRWAAGATLPGNDDVTLHSKRNTLLTTADEQESSPA